MVCGEAVVVLGLTWLLDALRGGNATQRVGESALVELWSARNFPASHSLLGDSGARGVRLSSLQLQLRFLRRLIFLCTFGSVAESSAGQDGDSDYTQGVHVRYNHLS
jgi:hypothetical protein